MLFSHERRQIQRVLALIGQFPQYALQTTEFDDAEYEEKHRKYEALYARRLRAKYFSKKALDGGNLYEQETIIDNEVIKSSRWPCTRSFADPIKYMEDQSQSSPEAETTATTNKKQAPKKSC
ncbi:hypothetical protein Cni_G20879 [Canna indica]|uniref:Uncharacterized protein n=1 Tax=Canna indica TaxID=4628 RepID=A0AAQ3KNX8_9LILI|nr:hypothetical protein Cni_G20879 [Canna indica]